MNEHYEKPEMEIIPFDSEDVIITSDGVDDGDDD